MAVFGNAQTEPVHVPDVTQIRFAVPNEDFLEAATQDFREHFETCLQKLAQDEVSLRRVCGPPSAVAKTRELHRLAEAEFCHHNAQFFERHLSYCSETLKIALHRNRDVTVKESDSMRLLAAERRKQMVRFMENRKIDI